MDVKEYFSKLNQAAQNVFNDTIDHCDFLGLVHDYSSILLEWANIIPDSPELKMFENAAQEIDVSCLSLLSGLYRKAFVSLRLSMEMSFGAVYFSVHKLEYLEWQKGEKDIVWSVIIDKENGVLSKRFSNAFFPELSEEITKMNRETGELYRLLSEYVHGNYGTWDQENPYLSKNDDLIKKYEEVIKKLRKLSLFLLCNRYLKELSPEKREMLEEHVKDELNHIEPIRIVLGGPLGNK
jgi:hypothetical protein